MNKKIFKILGVLLSVACLYFIFKKLQSLDENIIQILLSPDSTLLIASISALYIIALMFSAFGWSSLLKNEFESFKDSAKVTQIYIYTMIGKSLPSGMMHFAARQVILTKFAGLTHKQALKTIALDLNGYITTSLLIIAIGLCSGFIVYPTKLPFKEYMLFLGFALLLFIIIKEKIIQKIKMANCRFSKHYFRGMLFYILYFIIASLCFYFILKFFSTNTEVSFFYILFTYPICWLLGFIVFGAPAGIGVREAIMIYVFTTILPEDIIITSALILRATNIFGEVIGFLFIRLVTHKSLENLEETKKD